jgi:hypothetical protein
VLHCGKNSIGVHKLKTVNIWKVKRD